MDRNDVKRFYETFDFEKMITNPPKLIQDFLDGEIGFVEEHIRPGKKILEIGCGYGRLMRVLSKNAKKVVGIDFSKRMVGLAGKNLSDAGNVEILPMDADDLKFADGSFDYVLCLDNSFGNMPGIELGVLREMARTCKKGGEVIVSVFSENAGDVQAENYGRIGLKGIRDDGKAVHTDEGFYSRRFTKKELIELFGKAGLECEIMSVCPVNYIAYAVKG
ncbi:MAG: class I SAM-dependent methyltransferase [Candidatus Micrarchaeota archaeon]